MTVQSIIVTVCMMIFFCIVNYLNGYYDYMAKMGIDAAKKRRKKKDERRF